MLFIGIRLFSQVHYLGVGESEYIYIREIPYDGWVVAAAWNPDNDMSPYFTLSEQSSDFPERVKVTINHYFEGTLPVKVFYSYAFWGTFSNRIESGTTYQTFYFRCSGGGSASLSQSNLQLSVGQSAQLTCNRTMNYGNVRWSSSNSSIVSVDSYGKVTATGPGTATITCDPIVANNLYCSVTVNEVTPTGISIGEDRTVRFGANFKITPTFYPMYASSDVSWLSSDENVATVDNLGNVNCIGEGTTKITAVTTKGGCRASCYLSVRPKPTHFVVELKNGERLAYELSHNPKVEYGSQIVSVIDGTYSIEFPLDDIRKYALGIGTDYESVSGIKTVSVKDKGEFFQYGGNIYLSGFKANSLIGIYRTDGTAIDQKRTSEDGCLTISLSDYSSGIYIIKANNQSIKIIKR